jgi:hypothetical protein
MSGSLPGSLRMAESQATLQSDKHHIVGAVDCARLNSLCLFKCKRKSKLPRKETLNLIIVPKRGDLVWNKFLSREKLLLYQ